ncbi:hypothetical protein GDO78_000947 [Eleutherodactylus coqui]|uniref:Uncharacterized protein n=1 Tax=Eleutherodactylus coqui TaxID=57060 RepID=A0A8J6FSK2_ELECQ|nr:hypothetical protein GDO78_000947 [Eleutherodactylus coqui]
MSLSNFPGPEFVMMNWEYTVTCIHLMTFGRTTTQGSQLANMLTDGALQCPSHMSFQLLRGIWYTTCKFWFWGLYLVSLKSMIL